LVDVKSASSFSFKKFKDGNLADDDPFGYRGQLQSYLEASQDDPLLTDKDRAAFLVMDKTLGHICLDFHDRVGPSIIPYLESRKMVLEDKGTLPYRGYSDIADGKSGNRKLDVACSYCSFRETCWPGLRTFIYSNGPRHLTRVERTPDVPELV
jgi:hypothetical protein